MNRQPLKGSEKQVAFAVSIRDKFLEKTGRVPQHAAGLESLWDKAHAGKYAPDASWWLDRKNHTFGQILRELENCAELNKDGSVGRLESDAIFDAEKDYVASLNA